MDLSGNQIWAIAVTKSQDEEAEVEVDDVLTPQQGVI